MTDLTPEDRKEALALARGFAKLDVPRYGGKRIMLLSKALVASEAALETSEKRVERLTEALRFYADESKYYDRYGDIDAEPGTVVDDGGKRAREALEKR